MEERDILRYVVKGITDDENTKLVLCFSRDVEELQDKLEFIVYSPVSCKNQSNFKNNKKLSGNQPKSQGLAKLKDEKCYNCGGSGHKGAECPDREKGPKCFKCQKFDHGASACSQNKTRVV